MAEIPQGWKEVVKFNVYSEKTKHELENEEDFIIDACSNTSHCHYLYGYPIGETTNITPGSLLCASMGFHNRGRNSCLTRFIARVVSKLLPNPYFNIWSFRVSALRMNSKNIYNHNNDILMVQAITLCVNSDLYNTTRQRNGVVAGDFEIINLMKIVEIQECIEIPKTLKIIPQEVFGMCTSGTTGSMFSHQIASVSVMKKIEEQIASSEHSFGLDTCVNIGDSGWCLQFAKGMDSVYICAQAGHQFQMLSQGIKIKLRGGILCNPTGGGKTRVMWQFIEDLIDRSRPHHQIARPSNSQLQPRVGGTLVILPVNLIDQWHREYVKWGGNNLEVLSIKTRKDITKAGLRALSSADVILVSFSLLLSTTYKKNLETDLKRRLQVPILSRCDLSYYYNAVVELARSGEEDAFFFEYIHWYRIIVDEIHSVVDHKEKKKVILSLSSERVWGVTATPTMTTIPSLLFYKQFLLHSSMTLQPSWFTINLNVINRAFMRIDDNFVYASRKHVHRIELTPAEQSIIIGSRFISNELEIRMCSYFANMDLVNNPANIVCELQHSSIETAVSALANRIDMYREKNKHHLRILKSREKNLVTYLVQMEQDRIRPEGHEEEMPLHRVEAIDDEMTRLNSALRVLREKIKVCEENCTNAERMYLFCNQGPSTVSAECPVCMENFQEIPGVPRIMFFCGHSICKVCFTSILRQRTTHNNTENTVALPCPVCRCPIKRKDMVQVDSTNGKEDGNRNKYGSKTVKICERARSILDLDSEGGEGGILMFTQWPDHARAIQLALTDHGISATYLEGNHGRRSNTIKGFITRNIRVLICCTEKDIDGIDLHNCKNIFFTHALVGTVDQVASIEKQCIGRVCRVGQVSTVDIHHFIAADSVEESLFVQAHPE